MGNFLPSDLVDNTPAATMAAKTGVASRGYNLHPAKAT